MSLGFLLAHVAEPIENGPAFVRLRLPWRFLRRHLACFEPFDHALPDAFVLHNRRRSGVAGQFKLTFRLLPAVTGQAIVLQKWLQDLGKAAFQRLLGRLRRGRRASQEGDQENNAG